MVCRVLLSLMLFTSCVSTVSIIDSSMASVAAGDKTALIDIQGCGQQPLAVVGYNYCRIKENTPTASIKLIFVAPITECAKEPCRSVKIYRASAPALSYDFPKDKNFIEVPWSHLVDSSVFSKTNDNFYGVRVIIKWIDDDSENQKSTVMDGEIRLKVLSETYDSVPSTSESAWKFKYKNQDIRVTTAGRAYANLP